MADEGMSAGQIAGGAAGLTAATLAYKGFNAWLPKAQLFVPKPSSDAASAAMEAAASAIGTNDNAALKELVNMKRKSVNDAIAATGIKAKLKQAAGVAPIYGMLSADTLQSAAVATTLSTGGYYVMEVPYNPASININGTSGGEIRGAQNGDTGVSQLAKSAVIARLTMSVDLVFEDINNADAFHSDGLQMNAEELVNLAGAGIMRLFGEGYSVQKQCDGLLALLNFKRLKQVIFLWGNMFFHGELTNVNVKYQMFNRYGDPILAKVSLVIEQNDSNKALRYESDMAQWNNAFDLAFEDKPSI